MKRQIKHIIGKLTRPGICFCTRAEIGILETARFKYTYSRALARRMP